MKDLILKVPPSSKDHCQGKLNAPLTLLEYGDYECIESSNLSSVLSVLKSEFRKQICFIFRHFPMTQIHPHAEIAALAAEAADQQGNFWDMHRLLFKNQETLSLRSILNHADSLNLDMRQFNEDLHRQDLLVKVHQDRNGGLLSGVTTTPALFFNGYLFLGPQELPFLKMMIEERLKAQLPPIDPEV